ncbi:hypothetical protein B0H10DRAFT_2187401 [Mycena sp. CBHHK59/15]|nr:hypothetical protein B0H10DRAFT_2187401 [Mycena sp. CBHHK59/15]
MLRVDDEFGGDGARRSSHLTRPKKRLGTSGNERYQQKTVDCGKNTKEKRGVQRTLAVVALVCIAMNVRRPSFRRSGRGPCASQLLGASYRLTPPARYPVRQLSGSHVPPRPHPRAASICTHVETDSRSSATGHDTPHTAQGRRDTSAALPRLVCSSTSVQHITQGQRRRRPLGTRTATATQPQSLGDRLPLGTWTVSQPLLHAPGWARARPEAQSVERSSPEQCAQRNTVELHGCQAACQPLNHCHSTSVSAARDVAGQPPCTSLVSSVSPLRPPHSTRRPRIPRTPRPALVAPVSLSSLIFLHSYTAHHTAHMYAPRTRRRGGDGWTDVKEWWRNGMDECTGSGRMYGKRTKSGRGEGERTGKEHDAWRRVMGLEERRRGTDGWMEGRRRRRKKRRRRGGCTGGRTVDGEESGRGRCMDVGENGRESVDRHWGRGGKGRRAQDVGRGGGGMIHDWAGREGRQGRREGRACVGWRAQEVKVKQSAGMWRDGTDASANSAAYSSRPTPARGRGGYSVSDVSFTCTVVYDAAGSGDAAQLCLVIRIHPPPYAAPQPTAHAGGPPASTSGTRAANALGADADTRDRNPERDSWAVTFVGRSRSSCARPSVPVVLLVAALLALLYAACLQINCTENPNLHVREGFNSLSEVTGEIMTERNSRWSWMDLFSGREKEKVDVVERPKSRMMAMVKKMVSSKAKKKVTVKERGEVQGLHGEEGLVHVEVSDNEEDWKAKDILNLPGWFLVGGTDKSATSRSAGPAPNSCAHTPVVVSESIECAPSVSRRSCLLYVPGLPICHPASCRSTVPLPLPGCGVLRTATFIRTVQYLHCGQGRSRNAPVRRDWTGNTSSLLLVLRIAAISSDSSARLHGAQCYKSSFKLVASNT